MYLALELFLIQGPILFIFITALDKFTVFKAGIVAERSRGVSSNPSRVDGPKFESRQGMADKE